MFAPSTTTTAVAQRQLIELKGASETFVVNVDDSSSSSNHILSRFKSAGINLAGLVTTTVRPHVFYAGFSPITSSMSVQLDAGAVTTSSNSTAATANMSTIRLGGQVSDNTGGDLTLLFLAVLNAQPTLATIAQAQKLAKQIYGIA